VAILASAAIAQTQTKPEKAAEPESKQAASAKPVAPAVADQKADCGCEGEVQPEVLAVVNGVRVTTKEVDEVIKDRIAQLRQQVIDARKRELDLQINSRLLEAEARKRKVSSQKLLEQEVTVNIKDPTEAEVKDFYEQNHSRIDTAFDEAKPYIIEYLRGQRQQEAAKRFAEHLRAASEVQVLVKDITPPATDSDRRRVLATLNGQPVTSADVEDTLRPLIFQVQEQTYNLRKEQIDLKTNDILLEQLAQERKVTTRALVETEILSKVKKVTEADAQKFFDQNRNRINGEFTQLKSQIIEYLNDIERNKAEKAFAEQLLRAATVQVFLRRPETPVYSIATDDQPWRGGERAAVSIIEFTDFQCPSCAKTQRVIDDVIKEYGDQVKLIVRDFPLQQHANAFKAAEAAEAARDQGKYWEFIAVLFQNQQALDVVKLKEYATQVGLDRTKFDESLKSNRYADKVMRDLDEGTRIGVNSTPTLFVNGKLVRERTREGLKAAIEAAIKTAGTDNVSGSLK
jgi:protein-disulfide isomerase